MAPTSKTAAMRIVLALDTSSNKLCCAVGRVSHAAVANEAKFAEENAPSVATAACVELLAQADHDCMRQANVELVGTCEQVLKEARLAWSDIDAIVVGRGPGSFTGVRIGIATAKGLACALRRPLFGVSTLDGCAWTNWKAGIRGKLAIAADAMRKEVYPGIYELSDAGAARMFAAETVCKTPACIDEWVAQGIHTQVLLTGDALYKYRELFEAAGFNNIANQELWSPSGEGLLYAYAAAAVGARTAVVGTATSSDATAPSHTTALSGTAISSHTSAPLGPETGDPALVLPIYTRLSDAEETERVRLGMHVPNQLAVTGIQDELANRHLQLRPMSVHDVAQVAALEAKTWDTRAHAAWSEQAFLDDVQLLDHSWWIAHDEGSVVAFAGGRRAGDDFEVLDVAVSEDRRREGIASKLLHRIAYDALMLNAQHITLEVASDDPVACAFYRSLGFKEVGIRRNYYGAGHDARIMSSALPLAEHPASQELRAAPESPTAPSSATECQTALGAIAPEPQTTSASASPTSSAREHLLVGERRSLQTECAIHEARELILAVESSCDETAAAIIDGEGKVLASKVASQVDFHARFGGVVPEIASRKHVEAIVGVYEAVMTEAGAHFGRSSLEPQDLSCVGVTYGPGLVGALVVGLAFAKGLCAAAQLPLVGVNHLEGHLMVNILENPELAPPFVASLVSGGNTMLVHVHDWGDYHILGETIDDAVGEAYDKVAKALGLGYPGGPVISRLAAKGNPQAINFPRAMMQSGDYRFSLSGLKTSVMTYIEHETKAGRPVHLPDLAASFEAAVIDVQIAKAIAAVEETGVSDFCLGGGVASNAKLRQSYMEEFSKRGVRVTIPSSELCTDNAIMIALAARRLWKNGKTHDLSLDANPRLSLEVSE